MASTTSAVDQLPKVHHFKLSDGLELQVNVTGFSNGHNAKVEIQLKNSSRAWILHWGCTYHGNTKWFFPADRPPGTAVYKQVALQTPFTKRGDIDVIFIELRDPKIHAIEFVIKDGRYDKWMKLGQGNFQIQIPKCATDNPPLVIPNDLIERKAYSIWESKGRPQSSPIQQKQQNYDDALREIQSLLLKGVSLNELQASSRAATNNAVAIEHSIQRSGLYSASNNIVVVKKEEQPIQTSASSRAATNNAVAIKKEEQSIQRSGLYSASNNSVIVMKEEQQFQTSYSLRRRHDIQKWLHKSSQDEGKKPTPSLSLIDVIENSVGGENVILRQSYDVCNYKIVVFLKVVTGDYHVLVAANTKGSTVLHWGVSNLTPKEWLAPPKDMLPEKSKLLDAACQTYFTDISSTKGTFQLVDINLQQRKFAGIQFVIWSGGSWINNNGANFFVGLNSYSPSGKIEHDGRGIIKWLLNEISQREKEAERSLMHRFCIATELTERCKSEGDMGLIGILVWLRFMACRQLNWNKNYNVKPREISEAQDKFTNLLEKIYLEQPNNREIVRLVLGCVGRGGEGHSGQRIRDEILVLQRNNNCKGGMMEEWHQKLHNNSSPDDVVICEALLNYVRCGFRIDVYWKTLTERGLTKSVLASYDRPIVSEPKFSPDTKDGLIRDLTSYLKTLKAVHSGSDLESAIDICLSIPQGHGFMDAYRTASSVGLPLKLREYLQFIKAHISDTSVGPLMEKLLESRIELRPSIVTSHGRLKDLIFLDIALDSAVRTTMERGLGNLNSSDVPAIMFFTTLVLENLCLSSVDNEELIYCTKDLYRVCESYKPSDANWALQTKAVVDRIRLALADKAEYYQKKIQPSVQYLGRLLSVEKGVIDTFTEELIRTGSAGSLSMLINRLDPILRKFANLGCWQVISPAEVRGFVVNVNELISVQHKVYREPTVIVANKVSGEEEIPDGAVAVLTSDLPDVLAHVSIRARNSKILFASCLDQNVYKDLKLKQGKVVSILLKLGNLIFMDISSSSLSPTYALSSSGSRGLHFSKKRFSGKYAISLQEFSTEMVGAKSCNIRFLSERLPSWIKLPASIAIPFGVFETILSDDINKEQAKQIYNLSKLVDSGDLSKLRAIQETVHQIKAPTRLILELKNKMKSLRIPWLEDESANLWNRAWEAIIRVWASKWNERAYISCRKGSLNHSDICMAILVQEIIRADYAFVIHTKNPISGDASEIYTEVVRGLGETLVGAYPGRAMSFTTRKTNLKSHNVIGYPSKSIGLYVKQSIIFRSDSNGEDLKGYAGAGLYDSLPMDKAQEVVLDYSNDPLVVDKAFQASLFTRIAEAGKLIEGLFGCPQDIEGVVRNGEVYVVQSRPQI
ncbi:Alpha-glucan water dikinase 2 [Heracleum sosnowskyi]|uniref:Alpha-glucan water dikinase 2 n=1 Tax=Heracleum sosnowskyi TaxID=360622 RepID=A0AAD8N8P5_9APIA|nr:Alpha-glucan water dikinase 2 [Heracleum sosnowskyi]